MMNFRKLLFELSELEAEEFTSIEVAPHLGHSVKVTSNDLRRLHYMGFLKRKRKKRLCLAENSKWCYRGFEYRYSISKQGKSYLKWMREQKPLEDIVYIKLAKEALSHLPEELKEKLLVKAAIRSSYKYRGPNRHFKLIEDEVISIAYLQLKNQELAKENKRLSEERQKLAQENHRIMDEKKSMKLYIAVLETIFPKKIKQIEQEKLKKSASTFKQTEALTDALFKTIKVLRGSRDHLARFLAFSLPKEKSEKMFNFISEHEKKGLAEVKQEIKSIKEKFVV